MKSIVGLFSLFFLCAFMLESCMSVIILDVVKPADVDIPSDVVTFSIVQRNEAPKGKGLAKNWEAFLSGEGIGVDKRSAEYATSGLKFGLIKYSRFTAKQASVNEQLYGTGTRKMSELLNWEVIEEICKKNGSEALIVLESFDSGFTTKNYSPDLTSKVEEGQVARKEFESRVQVEVYVAWRIYFPQEKRIIDVFDESQTTKRKEFGKTKREARRKLPRVESLVQSVAEDLGIAYAKRISPSKVKLSRPFYGIGSVGLKLARVKMLEKDYEGAIEMWDSEFGSTFSKKVKKRTTFNLAVGYEAKADYKNAIYWAKLSLRYGNKKANGYIRQLEKRVEEEARLKKQLEVKK